nr:immunoglobulin heavy chain junction region [Macaca mulatta]MOV53678.1 immunoglobulin heavy chain junction region [Macaca mulatta]MOV53982.1 immunoglobulin heavy chain junction region [Macaca mulatta]MOV54122.1 immunoglobulin heavy chain junction region [Macaca mulatta]MOV54279.1 immunoglobulin heavy chain junction region [Macaca mulatta]
CASGRYSSGWPDRDAFDFW